MPYSSSIFDATIFEVIKLIGPRKVLDIGAGAGKYGKLIKSLSLDIETIAIEIEKDYITRYDLTSVYNSVRNISAIDLINPKYYECYFDIIIFGDVIEHLLKSDGINLLNYLIYRSKWIVLLYPHQYLQNCVGGYTAESHISVWCEHDFNAFEKSFLIKKDTQRLIVLKGYIETPVKIEEINEILERYEE